MVTKEFRFRLALAMHKKKSLPRGAILFLSRKESDEIASRQFAFYELSIHQNKVYTNKHKKKKRLKKFVSRILFCSLIIIH